MTAAAQTEQKPQHTAGPWVYERGTHVHGGHHVITARHEGMTSASPLAVLSNILDEVDGSAEADARLIAAAPDLLAALKGMLVMVEDALDDHPLWSEITAARAAIAKATA